MSTIATVVISNSTREFDREYDYIIPDRLKDIIIPGIRVIVPFGGANKSREAFIVKLSETSEFKGLKEIKEAVDRSPMLGEDMLELARWMRYRYTCTYADAFRCMLPAGTAIKSTVMVRLLQKPQKQTQTIEKIINALNEYGGECEYGELKGMVGSSSFSKYIKQLKAEGVIEMVELYSTGVREKFIKAAYLLMSREEVVDEIESNRIRRIQHIRVLEMLLDNEYIAVADIQRFAGVSSSVINTLKKYGYIDFKDIEVHRDPAGHRKYPPTSPLTPTMQQGVVLDGVKGKIDKKEFAEILLHGVTGSGKTEVYLQLIQHIIEAGKQAIMLVPEISLTPQMVERFKSRFGEQVAVLHSRLSLGERFDQWRLIKNGHINVVVGARSAVFAPFSRLGLIIIDEEHEGSYKSETTPKYHAAEVARQRCINSNAVLLYGSATPSIETYFKAKNGSIMLYEMSERANSMVMPVVHIADMRKELEDGNRSMFSRKLEAEITRNIDNGEQTILFLNRRGYSSFVLCRSCGYTILCLNCNISLTYHAYDERLICHYCGYTIKLPKDCPKCGSGYIRQFGTGTQKVEEDIKKQYPESTVIRMDMDTTTCKNSHEEILRRFREENINIMIGTQMIAKGHDFPNVTLVGVLAADSLLNLGDYRSSEKTFQLITQVAGRAGRGNLAGRVIIQTYNTEDFSILAACEHDYKAFYRQEITVREKLDYPPFTNISTMILNGINDRQVFQEAKALKDLTLELFNREEEPVDVLGPARSPLSKIKNKYRWRIIVKCRNLDKLINVLTRVSDKFNQKRGSNTIDLSMDVNPYNML